MQQPAPQLRFVVTIAMCVAVSVAAEERRGGIAFHYAKTLTPRELEWYSRFEVLVTHDPLPRSQVDALHRRGTKLALYEWAVAYYASLATPWHRALPPLARLNHAPLHGHLGASNAGAHYYDPAVVHRERAEAIAKRLRAIGYDGVFLDTTTSESVHPSALEEFRRRHPDLDYDAAFERFLSALRRSVRLIVTNQGYRRAEHILPYADWDVSESLITRAGKFRPWNDLKDRWNSTAFLMRHLIAPAQKKFPRVRFAHINYLAHPSREDIERIVAIARLFDAEPVITTPSLDKAIESELFFLDLGRPRSRKDSANGSRRRFEKGVIVVTPDAARILRSTR